MIRPCTCVKSSRIGDLNGIVAQRQTVRSHCTRDYSKFADCGAADRPTSKLKNSIGFFLRHPGNLPGERKNARARTRTNVLTRAGQTGTRTNTSPTERERSVASLFARGCLTLSNLVAQNHRRWPSSGGGRRFPFNCFLCNQLCPDSRFTIHDPRSTLHLPFYYWSAVCPADGGLPYGTVELHGVTVKHFPTVTCGLVHSLT